MKLARVHALLLCALAAPAVAHAQSRCDVRVVSTVRTAEWQAPLGRTITLHAGDVSLRDALARLGTAARIRISYSPEALPLERRVCADYNDIAVGAALATLLNGVNVRTVVASADHVVLAPRAAEPAPEPEVAAIPVVHHEPVIAETTIQRADAMLPTNLTVIRGEQLRQRGARTLAQALNGAVPGIWMWGQSSTGLLAQYASVRGASSFHGTAPKVYIDGVELANPLLLQRISTDAIERIEVIRGPQGAALYGADAIGGVTNIITRHEVVQGGAPRISLQSGFGVSSSDFAAGSTLAQDHSISARTGSLTRSLGVNFAVGSFGEFAPDASARHVSGDASARMIGPRNVLTATLRFLADRSGAGLNPLVPDSLAHWTRLPGQGASALNDPQAVRQYTGGMSWTFQPNAVWKHTVVAGVDGYTLERDAASSLAPSFGDPRATQADPMSPGQHHISFNRTEPAPSSDADRDVTAAWRATLRLNSIRAFDVGDDASGRLTLAAEHSLLRQREGSLEQSRANTGISAQTEMSVHDRLSLTGGLRFEHDGGITSALRSAILPMLGGSYVAARGDVGVRLRAAYGKAIRWPQLPASEYARDPLRAAFRSVALGPEEQAGIETGIDVNVGRTLSLQLTRFDQTASGLTQPVGTEPPDDDDRSANSFARYALQSVGVIDNDGWEMSASLTRGRLALTGTASLVDSRVRSLSSGYSGDLQSGDRMLGVPARTVSMTASWTGDQTFASVTAARASDWVNYDLIALANASVQPDAAQLRSYWQDYSGVTHLRAALSRELSRGLSLTLSAENLLDVQVGEPDNITIVPGRTLSLGIRAAF